MTSFNSSSVEDSPAVERSTPSEQRRFDRYPSEIPVVVTTYIQPPLWLRATISGTLRDISRHGTCIEFDAPTQIRDGQPVMLSFEHPGLHYPLTILARIAWTDGATAGVEFTRVYRDDRVELPGPWIEWSHSV